MAIPHSESPIVSRRTIPKQNLTFDKMAAGKGGVELALVLFGIFIL